MRVKSLALGLAVAMAAPAAITAAQAEDGIYIPLMSYRTGPYSGAGAAIFNGISDYLHMLNERDGGVGGVRLLIEECETGYDTKKGVECYEFHEEQRPHRQYPGIDRDHAAVDPQGRGGQGSDIAPWPMADRPRLTAPTSRGSSIRRQPTGMARPHSSGMSPMSMEALASSRARRLGLSISMPLTVRSRSRCSRRWPRITASS